MRNIVLNEKLIVTSLALLVLLVTFMPVRSPRLWVYPIVRSFAQAKMNYGTRTMQVYATPHFIIKYTANDADTVEMVAKAAETAYQPVINTLGYTPQGKTMIIMYPDKSSLNKAFGWSGDQSAMGVYWGGVVQVLSPHAWMKADDSAEEFIHTGPMVHEFTHLVFDYLTNGNYPRWFTEGLAQYVEYRVNNYEWITPVNSLTGSLYSMEELDSNFDNLPNQALAYRESLAAVRYIADVYGEDKLREVNNGLKSGQNIQTVLKQVIGMDYKEFDASWRAWAVANMKSNTAE